MSALFDMGPYAAFIWPSYGVSALLLGASVWLTLRAYFRAKARLAALEKP